jgi:hypothetical protein
MKAQIGVLRKFHWFDINGAVSSPGQVNGKLYVGNTLVKTFTSLTPHGTFPDLYISTEEYAVTSEEPHTFIIYQNTTALDSVLVESGLVLSPEAEYNTAPSLRLSTSIYTSGATISAYYLAPNGTLSVVKTATKVTAKAAYVISSPLTLDQIGPWQVIWVDASMARYVQEYWVGNHPGLETVKVIARLNILEDSPKYVGATVVASSSDGTQLGQAVTDANGAAFFDLAPADVTFSIIKAGAVFTTNNFVCKVRDTKKYAGSNIFPLVTNAFYPTTTSPSIVPPLCSVYATLLDFSGSPLKFADVLFSVLSYPQLASGAGVVGTSMVAKTDSNGYMSVSLVQGTKVEVAIPAASLRRIITIPSSVGPTNLLTLVSASADVFDAVSLTLPAAPRRTL